MKVDRNSSAQIVSIDKNDSPSCADADIKQQCFNEPDSSKNGYEYQIDELVWAKIIGYPWWPGIVSNKMHRISELDPEKQYDVVYQICFFGDQTNAYLQRQQIYQYSPNRDYFMGLAGKNRKIWNRKDFAKAVAQADQIAQILILGRELQSEDKIIEESSLNATNSSPKPKPLIDIETISHESNKTQENTCLKISKRKNKKNQQNQKKNYNSLTAKKQIAIVLYKLIKNRTKEHISTVMLKRLTIELLKQNKLDTVSPNLEQNSQRFMALLQRMKNITSFEIANLISSKFKLNRAQDYQQLPSIQKKHLTSYIYIDEFGHQHISQDPLLEVEIQPEIHS